MKAGHANEQERRAIPAHQAPTQRIFLARNLFVRQQGNGNEAGNREDRHGHRHATKAGKRIDNTQSSQRQTADHHLTAHENGVNPAGSLSPPQKGDSDNQERPFAD